ncbi:MAG: histidine kinase dimerization/phospho-acceptor domain-containing protein [Planctomycetota bacterium]
MAIATPASARDVALLVFDEDGTLVDASPAAWGILGVGPEERISLARLFPDLTPPRPASLADWAARLHPVGPRHLLVRGHLLAAEFAAWIPSHGDLRGRLCILLALARSDSLPARTGPPTAPQALMSLAHEMDNALSKIAGYAQLLLISNAPTSQRGELERIHDEALRMALLVDDLRALARASRPDPLAAPLP